MANQFSAVKKINYRGVEDDVLEIFVDTYDIYRMNNLVAELGTYTFVVWYCSAAECKITFNILGTSETVDATTEWKKFIKTVEYDGKNNNIDISQDLDSTIYLYEAYITKGSQDKSWSLAPEDWEDGREERDDLITETMTFAQQTADKFAWLVKDGTNETNFTLTSRTADLVSEQINLKGLVTFSGLNSSVPSEIIGILAEEPAEGSTTIHGGYIQTNSIDSTKINTDNLYSNSAFISAVQATSLNAEMITSGTIKANLLNLYGLKVYQENTDIETLSIENTGDVTLRGNVESFDYVAGQSGWSIKSDGDAEFNDVVVRGDLINASGGIVATDGNAVQVNAWFGSSYDERESAPFIIYSDGSMVATKGTFGGVFTGDIQIGNISIIDPSNSSGNDAILTIQNGGDGVKRVQLKDTDSSDFAQKIRITDNFYNEVIALGQDGYGIFNGGITAGSGTTKSTLTKDSLSLNGSTIDGSTANTIKLLPTTLNVGSTSLKTSLNVYGSATFKEDATFEGDIMLGTKLKITTLSNGVDIDFIT